MTAKRYYLIGGRLHVVRKSMFAGRRQTNAKGQWIWYWYAKPADASDAQDNWTPIGRTLTDVRLWAKTNNASPAGTNRGA